MIGEGLTLAQVDALYQQAGIGELFVMPWYEVDPARYQIRTLSGLITGTINNADNTAFLEFFIVTPAAINRHQVKLDMVEAAYELLRARGISRVTLCIDNENPKFERLDAWAKLAQYTKYAEAENRSWYVREIPLTP